MFVSEFLNSFMKSSSFNVSLYKSVIVGFVYNSYKAEFERDKNEIPKLLLCKIGF